MVDTPLASALTAIIGRGDIADLVLVAWALAASGAALKLLRDLNAANTRFEDFIRELHRFNAKED